jgi:plastocyanin
LKFLIVIFAIGLIPVAFAQTDYTSDEEVKAMVLDAIDLYDEIGTDSFESFNSSPDFHKSDLYMFVFRDSDSIMVAHGANMDLIGKSVDKILDIYGESIGKMIHQKATKEGVWVEYLWEDPIDKKVHPKTVWVVKHDGYIFGTGSYSDAEPTTVQPTDEQLEKRTTPLEVIIPVGSPLVGCENLNTCYVPYQSEIYSGESIVWKNVDSEPHTITSGLSETPLDIFDSGMMMSSESFEFTFTDSGEYDYYCTVHPWMTGKIMVREIPMLEDSGTIHDDESVRDKSMILSESETIVSTTPAQDFQGNDGTKQNNDDCKNLEPITYQVGLDLSTIGEIDTKTGSYELIFWQTFVSEEVDFTKCPPPSEWDYTNGYIKDKQGVYTEPHFHKFEVHGVFFSEFDFRDYPFEKLNLSVYLEPYYPITAENIIFVVNDDYSGIEGTRVTVPGWGVGTPIFETRVDSYEWGDFPNFSANIPIESPPVSVFLKKVLPAIILGFFGFSTFFLSSKRLEERLTVIGAGMIGAIFFHAVYLLGELPPLGYLTIADKIMISIYSIFSMSFLGAILQQNHQNKLERANQQYSIVDALAIDKKMMKVTPIFATAVFLILYFLT